MKRVFWALGLLLLAGYAAWPYVTVYQLDAAIRAQDEPALDRMVDWNSLAFNLEQDFDAVFAVDAEGDPEDELAANLIGIFTDLLVEPIVSFYTTPRGLAYLLNTQVILDDPFEVLEEDFPAEDTWANHIGFAFFSGPAHFRVRVNALADAKGTRGEPMILEFRLQNFSWQLTRVRLPIDEITE